ncbi:unnamed protein product [Bubo scandiacus]
MLGQVGCTRLRPSGPAFLLLLLGATMTSQDTCSSPGHPCAISPGDLPAPELVLNTFGAREGERVLFQCSIGLQSPATPNLFLQGWGGEVQPESPSGETELQPGAERHPGERRDIRVWVPAQEREQLGEELCPQRSPAPGCQRQWVQLPGRAIDHGSPSRAPRHLPPRHRAGSGHRLPPPAGCSQLLCREKSGLQREMPEPGHRPQNPFPLLSRQQQLPSQEPEVTSYTEIQYSTIAHVGCNRPRVQETNITTAYATVNHARSQPR